MAKLAFYCDAKDRTWLKETHLKDYVALLPHKMPSFLSFILIGNEDCPDEILLYESVMPLATSKPIAKFAYKKSLDRYEREF